MHVDTSVVKLIDTQTNQEKAKTITNLIYVSHHAELTESRGSYLLPEFKHIQKHPKLWSTNNTQFKVMAAGPTPAKLGSVAHGHLLLRYSHAWRLHCEHPGGKAWKRSHYWSSSKEVERSRKVRECDRGTNSSQDISWWHTMTMVYASIKSLSRSWTM